MITFRFRLATSYSTFLAVLSKMSFVTMASMFMLLERRELAFTSIKTRINFTLNLIFAVPSNVTYFK